MTSSRIPLTANFSPRASGTDKDSLPSNVFIETSAKGTKYITKRPGITTLITGSGQAQGIYGGFAFYDAALNWIVRTSGVAVTLTGATWFSSTSKFYVVGTGATLRTSSDGITWGSETITSSLWSGISASDSLIVACSNDGPVNSNIATSIGNGTWTIRDSGTPESLNGVCYSSSLGLWVVVGDNGKIITSPNGTTWTARTSGTSSALISCIFGNGIFVIAGWNGTILTSTNGTAWTARTSGVAGKLNDVSYGNGYFVVVGTADISNDSVILRSVDGITWDTIETGSRGYSASVYGDRFVIVDDAGSKDSTNGASWTSASFGASIVPYGVTYSSTLSLFVVCGSSGKIQTASSAASVVALP